jgi:hypothetical protein
METNENPIEPTQPEMPAQPPTVQQRAQEMARTGWQQFQQRTPAWSPVKRALVAASAGIIAVCLVCAVCASMAQAVTGGSKAVANSAQATHTATATLSPAAAYGAIVSLYSTRLSASLSTMGDDCQNGDVSACRDDAKSMQDDVHAFLDALDATPAPQCLKEADGHLRAALALFDRAAQHTMDGIDNDNTSLISKATTDMTNGSKELTKATDAMKAATC